MNHRRGNAVAIQAFGNTFRATLGAREDQAAAAFFAQQRAQEVEFAIDGDLKGLEPHIFCGLESGPESNTHRVSGVILDQVSHVSFHSRGEAHGLALLWQNRRNPADGG